MSATNHTTNYNLPQFIGTDIPTWLSDFNGAMRTIDTSIKDVSDSVSSATEASAAVNARVDTTDANVTAVAQRVTTAEQNIATLQQGLGVNTSAVSALDTKVTAVESSMSNIGATITGTETTTNVTDRSATSVASLQLPAGVWIIEAGAQYPINTASYRALSINTVTNDLGGVSNGRIQFPAYDGFVFLHTEIIVEIEATTTFYALTYHHANTSLQVTANMKAVRIK